MLQSDKTNTLLANVSAKRYSLGVQEKSLTNPFLHCLKTKFDLFYDR